MLHLSYLSSPERFSTTMHKQPQAIQHKQGGGLMQNRVCFDEFSLSLHRHKLKLPERTWHQSCKEVFLTVTGLLALMIDTTPRKGLPAGLHSSVVSRETGNNVKLVPVEQFVDFCWLGLSTRDQAFGPGFATRSLHGPRHYFSLLWLCFMSVFLSVLYLEFTGAWGQATFHHWKFSSP